MKPSNDYSDLFYKRIFGEKNENNNEWIIKNIAEEICSIK
jgi:hypothetical protein